MSMKYNTMLKNNTMLKKYNVKSHQIDGKVKHVIYVNNNQLYINIIKIKILVIIKIKIIKSGIIIWQTCKI